MQKFAAYFGESLRETAKRACIENWKTFVRAKSCPEAKINLPVRSLTNIDQIK